MYVFPQHSPPPLHSGSTTEFRISDGLNHLTTWDFVLGIVCLDYRPWLCQSIELYLLHDYMMINHDYMIYCANTC